jgi:YD repeat-containing protein
MSGRAGLLLPIAFTHSAARDAAVKDQPPALGATEVEMLAATHAEVCRPPAATTTDANGQTTGVTYDALGRPTSRTQPGEGAGLAITATAYTVWCAGTAAQSPCTEVDKTQRLTSSTTVTSRAFYDGLGHRVETRSPGRAVSGAGRAALPVVERGLVDVVGVALVFLITPDDGGSLAMGQQYVPPPSDLAAFPDATRVSSKTPVGGGRGLRRRWKDLDGKIYEWDYQHGRVELYDKRGRHLGEFDPQTGERTGGADAGRRVEP